MSRVDLVWSGSAEGAPRWSLGTVYATEGTVAALHQKVEEVLQDSSAEYLLFWDSALGHPDERSVRAALSRPGDLWHAGLKLGQGGRPRLLNAVSPTWMLNRDPDPDQEATSWRVSLRACLVRTAVLRSLGQIRPTFKSLDAAALELGHRCVFRGALTRHLPTLVPGAAPPTSASLPLEDEARFVLHRSGRFWMRWALVRAVLTGTPWGQVHRALRSVRSDPRFKEPEPYRRPDPEAEHSPEDARVTVLIPTIDRYPYLRNLLTQLGQQTLRPAEVIIVDQTPAAERDLKLVEDFPALPLQVYHLEEAGQCTSRNLGLARASGDYVLLLDDDVEIAPTFVEDHLRSLARHGAHASCGVIDEVGAGPRPSQFNLLRVSEVFPAGNTLLPREVLRRSGLFDLAYNRGARADGDLGMRVYLSGALIVLNPGIPVLHHRAPRGGLRAHRARVVTYASSRTQLWHRHIPSATEVYLARRYFSAEQVREMLWLRALGTLSIRGPWFLKLAKIGVGLVLLPNTLLRLAQRYEQAVQMSKRYPEIPTLPDR